MNTKDVLRLIRRLVKAGLHHDVVHRAEVRLPTQRFGSDYGGWVVYTANLSESSVVYSFGVGEDTSFDLALIDRYGVTIEAFDPTPKSVSWVAAQPLPSSFRFHELGIADFDGTATFNAPADPSFVSYTLADSEGNAEKAVTANVQRLSTIMESLGHDHIDVLKLDVEGAEYRVVSDILAADLDVRQILVEFHHAFETIETKMTDDAVALLRSHGFVLFNVSPGGEDFSFIREDEIRPE